MRLFGTFKFIEAYLIICAILLLYSFQKLCKQEKISDVDGFLNHQGYLRLSDSVLKKVYKNESDTDAVDLGVVDVHRGPPDVPRDSYAINKSRVRGELNDVVVTLPPHEEEVVTDKFSRNGSEPVPARTVVADPVTTTHESLKKGLELEEEVQRHHHNPELMGKKLPKLDEDVLDVSTNASAEPAVDQGNHPVVEADKTPVALHAGIHFPPVDNELSSTKPLALTSEPPSSGVLNYFSDLFSSKARQRRNVDKAYDLWTKKPLIANQTSIGAYRCEKIAMYIRGHLIKAKRTGALIVGDNNDTSRSTNTTTTTADPSREPPVQQPTSLPSFEEIPVIAIEPPEMKVAATGGVSIHHIVNLTDSRLSFKVKSSNNYEYGVKPVFGFVEPGASTPLEVTRIAGPPKEDKLVVQFAGVDDDETNPQTAFLQLPDGNGEVVIPVYAQ